MLGRRPPTGLVGIPQSLRLLATPTLPATEATYTGTSSWVTGDHFPVEEQWAVLAPPTGDGVLNQIPAGDGRESSREQVVPGDRAPFHRSVMMLVPGDHFPSLTLLGFGGRAASLTHKKKKKKKKKVA